MEKNKKKQNQYLTFLLKNMRWILFIICVIIFLIIIKNIFEQEIHILDNGVYQFIAQFISEPMTYVMKLITTLGSAIVLCSICLVLLLIFQKEKYGIYAFLNLTTITILNFILKNIFDRPRPEQFRLVEETGFSFPSGHSMVSMAFYGFLIYIIWKKVKNSKIKWITCIGLFIVTVVIGISRIYLGVHYASDVLGGFCFSIAYLACYTQIISNLLKEKTLRDNNS